MSRDVNKEDNQMNVEDGKRGGGLTDQMYGDVYKEGGDDASETSDEEYPPDMVSEMAEVVAPNVDYD